MNRYTIICLASVLWLLLGTIHNSHAKTMVSLATVEWPPYVGQKLKNYGFASEIITEAFARVGYTVQISFLPWERALRKVAEGKYDATYPAYYSEERTVTYLLSNPFSTGILGFYKRKDMPISFQTLHDLQAYTIGVVRGYVNTEEFDNAPYLKKDIADNDEQNIRKLLKGRVDLIVIDRFVAHHILHTTLPEGISLLEFVEPPLAVKALHLLFSRAVEGYEQTVKDFHYGLQQISTDGTIQKILQKHGLE